MLFHEHTFFCRSAVLRKKELADTGDCRMLTEIPVRDWENCDAVPSTLSALIGVVVPGQLRKVETVFVVSDLQILGISSVKSETDEWLITSCVRCKRASPCAQHPDGSTEKRLAVRLTLADGNSQCSVMLYHELLLKAAVLMEITLPEPLADSKELRTTLRDMFRNAQWICRFTFKENDFQQSLELECRDIRPCLRLQPTVVLMTPPSGQLSLPLCRLNNGCPVAPLKAVTVDSHLGLVSVGKVDANFLRALVCFNNVKLPDDEALQQDNTATSAMRVKRSFDCLLSKTDTSPFQVKLRMAGPASVVNWLLQGRTGEIHQVVLAQTEHIEEWSVLWHVPVDAAAKDTVTAYFDRLATAELTVDDPLTFESKWTPVKRLNVVRDSMPEEARSSTAWTNTLPASSEVAATGLDERMWTDVCSAAVSRRLVLKRLADFPGSACLRKHAKSQPPDPTKRCELLLVPQHSVGNGTWSVLLNCLAPGAWDNVAAHRDISRVWLLQFLQFCATSRNMSTSQKKSKAFRHVWLFASLAWLLVACCVAMIENCASLWCSYASPFSWGHDPGLERTGSDGSLSWTVPVFSRAGISVWYSLSRL